MNVIGGLPKSILRLASSQLQNWSTYVMSLQLRKSEAEQSRSRAKISWEERIWGVLRTVILIQIDVVTHSVCEVSDNAPAGLREKAPRKTFRPCVAKSTHILNIQMDVTVQICFHQITRSGWGHSRILITLGCDLLYSDTIFNVMLFNTLILQSQ